jgi:hypothetical protein
MAKCSQCGAETTLHVASVPICAECDEKTEQITTFDDGKSDAASTSERRAGKKRQMFK